MQILNRLSAAWLAFRSPRTYWEGVTIRKIAQQVVDRDGMAFICSDPQNEYVVHMIPPDKQYAIQLYLLRP